jgi:hypothetical protein
MPDLTSIETYLRQQLPDDKKQASWGYLAQQFPFYPVLHWLRAANHPDDQGLKQMAALYANDTFRFHIWLNGKKEVISHEVANVLLEPTSSVPLIEILENESDITEKYPEEAEDTRLIPPDGDENLEVKPFVFNPDLGKESTKAEFVFEPFHTVDYFASQGIKVEKGSDTPLDRQVKSFTEWLKSMKKLSYQPAASYNDPLVERQARTSLTDGEVVTEAMAEVWAKQGQMDKAEAVFIKLKLLHPEKSHYFAARLKDIKENS